MNDTINQQQNQGMSPDMTHEEAKASMGIATRLQDMLLPQTLEGQQTQNPDQEGGQMSQPQKDPMAEMQDLKTQIMSELQTLRDDVKMIREDKEQRTELADIKKQIQQVLDE